MGQVAIPLSISVPAPKLTEIKGFSAVDGFYHPDLEVFITMHGKNHPDALTL
jgi:hypothetical protein